MKGILEMKNTNEISLRYFVLEVYFKFSEGFLCVAWGSFFGICPQGQGG